MKTNQFHFYSMMAFVTLFPFCIGGYYAFFCALADVFLVVLLLIAVLRKQQFTISKSFAAVTVTLITLLYLLTKFWAVDKTMSLYGFVKLLTPFLWMLNFWQVDSEDRPKLLTCLPPAATVMTVAGFSLGQITSLHTRFFDNLGDLHGMFEYANAYAIYLLIAVIIALCKPKKSKWKAVADYVMAAVCCVGIYLSNSRAVMLLTAGIVALLLLDFLWKRLHDKKAKRAFVGAVLIVAIAAVAVGFGTGLVQKLYDKVMADGPFVERLVFWHDSFLYGIRHPFGKGAFAFYYVQPQIQSAFYYVIDVHNDYLQMLVEIGLLPTLCFIALIAKHLFSKSTPLMNRMIVFALALHCFMDYDFQFMAIFVIFVMCLDFPREQMLTVKSKLIPVLITAVVLVFSYVLGLSSYYNYVGNQLKSNYYYKNTSAMVLILQSINDQQAGYELANDILANNDQVFEANYVLSNIYSANERYEEAFEQMELVLKKNPRNIDNYEAYIDLCATAVSHYEATDDTATAKYYLQQIADIPQRLEELKANTNKRAMQYGRKQVLTLDEAHQKTVEASAQKLQTDY